MTLPTKLKSPYKNRLEAFISLHDTKIKTLEKVTRRGRGAIKRWRLNLSQPDRECADLLCAFYGINKDELFYFDNLENDASKRDDRGVQGDAQDGVAADPEG